MVWRGDRTMKKVLLYSSGMDSYLIDKLYKPDVKLFVRLHTPGNDKEYERVTQLVKSGSIDNVEVIDYDLSKFEQPDRNYYLPLRNLHLLLLASHFGDEICIGSVSTPPREALDNNETFAKKAEDLTNYLLQDDHRQIRIVMPYTNYTKADLLKIYLDRGGDIETAWKESLSCFNPVNNSECLSCPSCASKFTAFYKNGYKFNDYEIQKFMTYVGQNQSKCEYEVTKLYWTLLGEK